MSVKGVAQDIIRDGKAQLSCALTIITDEREITIPAQEMCA